MVTQILKVYYWLLWCISKTQASAEIQKSEWPIRHLPFLSHPCACQQFWVITHSSGPGIRRTVCTEAQHVGSRPSLMWNGLLTTQEGWVQPRTLEVPAAFGAAQSNPLFFCHVITAFCTEKLTTLHVLLPHGWMGNHQHCAWTSSAWQAGL